MSWLDRWFDNRDTGKLIITRGIDSWVFILDKIYLISDKLEQRGDYKEYEGHLTVVTADDKDSYNFLFSSLAVSTGSLNEVQEQLINGEIEMRIECDDGRTVYSRCIIEDIETKGDSVFTDQSEYDYVFVILDKICLIFEENLTIFVGTLAKEMKIWYNSSNFTEKGIVTV